MNPNSGSDSVKISAKAARNMLIKAQQAAILEDEVKNLHGRIIEKEKQLSATGTRDSILISSLGAEIRLMKDQRGIFEGEMKSLQKQLKRERTKTKLVAFAGILTTVGAALLIK